MTHMDNRIHRPTRRQDPEPKPLGTAFHLWTGTILILWILLALLDVSVNAP